MNFNDWLQQLGMPPLVRDLDGKFTQLVKNHHEATWTTKIQPLPCIVMEKMDGVCALLINIGGDTKLFSRTGRKLNNVEHLEKLYNKRSELYDMVCCVELCNDSLSLEQISGACNPNRVEALASEISSAWNQSYLSFYDLTDLDSFIEGHCVLNYATRLDDLEFLNLPIPAFLYAYSESQVSAFRDTIISQGGEGIVRCSPIAGWKAGRKNREKTKEVRGVDLDLEVIGVVEGKGKRAGTMAKVVVRWRLFGDINNPPIELAVDGCFSDEFRLTCWTDPSVIVGQIAHVHALQIGSKGSLRLAKVKTIRIDKFKADV